MLPVDMALVIVIGVCALAAGVAAGWLVCSARTGRRADPASDRVREIGSLTSGLAHEIRNPLSTIGLNAQLLSEAIDDLDAPEEGVAPIRRRLEALGRETERLGGILQDFLEFAGEVRLVPRPTDINALVEELGDFFSGQAARAGVRLRVETAPEELTAVIDADHVKQAAMNLVLNAMQAMERTESGSKELIIRAAPCRVDGRSGAAVHVIDTGPGIDAEARSRIFDPYFTTRAGGTGLGLPTARRLVEAHGGRLELFSEPGTGSDFAMLFRVGGASAD